MEINLIDAAQVIAYTAIQDNVDQDFISKYIKTAQLQKIKPILGAALYQALQDRVEEVRTATEEDPASSKPELDALLGLIEQPLALWVFVKVAPFLEIKVTEKGFKRKNSAQSDGVEFSDIGKLTRLTEEDAIYTGVLQNFLEDNADSYTEYGRQIVQPKHQSSGLYIPKFTDKYKYPEGWL